MIILFRDIVIIITGLLLISCLIQSLVSTKGGKY